MCHPSVLSDIVDELCYIIIAFISQAPYTDFVLSP